MDKIDKALLKIPLSQRKKILLALEAIVCNDMSGLDVKKLKGEKRQYRVRVGIYRIIYRKVDDKSIVQRIAKRDERTY